MTYSKIVDPFSGKSYSIYDNQGKQILNNYFKVLQNKQRGGSCAVPATVNVPTGCFEAPDVSGYRAPCGQLPLDHAFASYKGGSRKKKQQRRRKHSKKN